ncbi:auxin efflux carrier [Abortiporus biennis]|nr:auxin efflux carrier [Abortiporus biennis]
MVESSFTQSFVGAVEGVTSVLLTLFAGYILARFEYVDRDTVRCISKVCSVLFLPCLIIVQMGPELTTSKLDKLWIIPVWGFVSTVIAHLIGWAGQVILKMPHWTIVASGRPNSNALPLLLLQSLRYTTLFSELSSEGESVADTLDRAKSLILLNAIVQQTLTFQFAPSVLRQDRAGSSKNGKARDVEDVTPKLVPESTSTVQRVPVIIQDSEHVGLLQDTDNRNYGASCSTEYDEYSNALQGMEEIPNIHWPRKVEFMRAPIVATLDWMSPPLIGAIIALIIGIIPPLHSAFLEKRGALYSSITQSLKNLGDLFAVLQTVVVGAELALVPRANPGVIASIFTLSVRFLVMPLLSVLFVWTTAGKGLYIDDKLVWFLLILIPSGPSALLLVSVAEMVNIDQGPIAGYLAISYLVSPLMAIWCSFGLKVVQDTAR